jgi:hypothetical protein
MLQFLSEMLGSWATFKTDRLGPGAVRPLALFVAAMVLVAVCALLLIRLVTGRFY